jgi:hypothetical protein
MRRVGPVCALITLAISASAAVAQPARPLLVAPGPAEVVLVDERALAPIRADWQTDSTVARCTARTRLNSAEANTAVQRFRAWDFDETFARDPSTVVILLLPVERGRMDCRDADSQRTVAAARGLRFSRDTALTVGEEIVAAELYRGDVRLAAASLAPMLFVTPWGDRMGAAQGWRFDVPLERLAPAAWGSTDDVYLLVQRSGEAAQRRVGIPAATIDSLWGRASARRAARLPAISPPESRLFAAPPEDGALLRAYQAFAAGEMQQPVVDAGRRFAGRGLSDADRRSAAVQLASTFAHAGDEPMARHYLRRAFDVEPCLALNAETPAALARLALPFEREGGRCTSRSAVRFVLTGGLIPGAARPLNPRRAAIGALATIAALIAWDHSRDGFERSRELYREYLAFEYTGGSPVGPLALAAYDEAEAKRRQAVWLLRAAIGLVTASVAEGAWSEFRYNAYLRDIRDYGQVLRVP